MNKLKTIWSNLLLVASGISLNVIVYGQCSFTGLDPIYCESDDPVTLIGDPGGGIFSGTGIVGGDTFDPSVAGPGLHTITYESWYRRTPSTGDDGLRSPLHDTSAE